MNKIEESLNSEELMLRRSGGVMRILGWVFSGIGAVGTIVSKVSYDNAADDYENRIYSFYTESRSDMEITQTALYISIGVFVLGIILLVAGYVTRSQKQSQMKTDKIIQQLANNQGGATAPVNVPASVEIQQGVQCPNCGSQNKTDAKFCNACGQQLETAKICSECGFENPPAAKFCKNCGNNLTAD